MRVVLRRPFPRTGYSGWGVGLVWALLVWAGLVGLVELASVGVVVGTAGGLGGIVAAMGLVVSLVVVAMGRAPGLVMTLLVVGLVMVCQCGTFWVGFED